jgi:hypothetical protein
MTNLVQKSDITALTSSFNINNLVQKSDLAGVAQKTDLAGVAQKTDLADVAKTSDLSGVAQKSDLTGLGKCNPNSNSESPNAFEIANAIKQTMLGINKDNSISCPINYTHLKSGSVLSDKVYGITNDANINDFKGQMGEIICGIEPTSVFNVYDLKIDYWDENSHLLPVNLEYPLYRYRNSNTVYESRNGKTSSFTCPQNTFMIPMNIPFKERKSGTQQTMAIPMCILNMETYADRICTYGYNFNKNNNRFYCNPPPS